jgi:hypothetical protein
MVAFVAVKLVGLIVLTFRFVMLAVVIVVEAIVEVLMVVVPVSVDAPRTVRVPAVAVLVVTLFPAIV